MKPPVLLLDDDPKWLQICLWHLPQADYALQPTTSLSDALHQLAAVRHPVAVCDLRLIGVGPRGGFELLTKAKTISEHTKVIIITAYGGAATGIAQEAWIRGAFNYLTKPIDFLELDECIVMAIQSWRQEVEAMVGFGELSDGPELAFLHGRETTDGLSHFIGQPDSSIARIRAADGKTIGLGFLVGERQILTCVHVIARALVLPSDISDVPQEIVQIDFPLVAPDQIVTARVTYWQPESDVTGLELIDRPPSGSKPVCLVTADDMWGHTFRVFGFPVGYDHGVWASGVLRGRTAAGWIQIEDTKPTGYLIAPGFSGGPVWDNALGGVVGMVVAADTSERVKAAFLIPTEILVGDWSDLAYDR